MRKSTAFAFALCGTLLLAVLFVGARMMYIGHHSQSFEKIAGKGEPAGLTLTENGKVIAELTESERIAAVTDLLKSYTYTEYPHFFHPRENELSSSRLTVSFENGRSIGVNADGYVFVNDKLRDVEGGRGKEFYHLLYIAFYPSAE